MPYDPLPSGPFTRADLRARGIPDHRVDVAAVRRVTHGVHRLAGEAVGSWTQLGYPEPPAPLSPEETAAVVRESRGVCSHVTALLLHRLPVPAWVHEDGRVHVSRPHGHGAARRREVRSHARSVRPEDRTVLHGIPVTTPERTWADLASLSPRGPVDPLVAAGDALVTPPWTPSGRVAPRSTSAALAGTLDRAGRFKGVVVARSALGLVRVGADSPQETALRLELLHAGIPEPELQLRLHPARLRSPDADLGWRRWRLVIHYDGATHLDRAQRAVDVWRDEGWARAGWTQLRATAEDAADDFRRIVREVQAHRRRLGGREHAVC